MAKKLTRREKWWKGNKFPGYKTMALTKCQQRGHKMVLDSKWQWRIEGIAERFFCLHCRMEMFVQMRPPAGYKCIHGTAYGIDCLRVLRGQKISYVIFDEPEDFDAETR